MEDTNWEVEQEPPLNRLEKGSEDWVLFHTLVRSTPGFLSLSAAKVKKYHQFSKYHTTYLNSFIQNARKAHRKKEEASKKSVDKEEGKKNLNQRTKREVSGLLLSIY